MAFFVSKNIFCNVLLVSQEYVYKSHSRNLFQPYFLITVVVFPEFVKLYCCFNFVTLYARYINKRDARSYSVFCDYLNSLQNIL